MYNFTSDTHANPTSSQTTGSYKGGNNYDQGLFTAEQLNAFLEYRPLGLLVCTLGFVASCLNIVINWSLRHDAYVIYLTGISLSDFSWFLSDWIYLILYMVLPFTSRTFQMYNHYHSSVGGVVFQRSAIIFNCLASSERFLKLTFPFQISNNVLNRFPRLVLLCVFTVVFLLNIPLLLELEVKELAKDVWMLSPTITERQNSYLFLSLRNLSRALLFYGPLIYLFVINLALVISLKLHANKQQDIRATRGKAKSENQQVSKSSASNERSAQAQAVMTTSRLVFVLTLTFLLLSLPTTLNSTVDSFVDDYGFYSRNANLFLMITFLAEWTAFLIEPCLFVVSVVLSRQFRAALFGRLHRGPSASLGLKENSVRSDLTRTMTVSK